MVFQFQKAVIPYWIIWIMLTTGMTREKEMHRGMSAVFPMRIEKELKKY